KRIESEYRQPVRRKAPESRPTALDGLDRPIDDALKPVDRNRDVEFIGRRVARIRGSLVVRADPDPVVTLALEIESLERIIDERQVAHPGPADSQLGDGPPIRANPKRRSPATGRDVVGPG